MSRQVNTSYLIIMLDKIYLETLNKHLKESNVLTVEILVWLIQSYKTIQIEKLSKYRNHSGGGRN